MKKVLSIFLPPIICVLFLFGCNKNLTDEEKKEMYSKSTSRDAIIERSGTKIRAGTDEAVLKAQMDDAENRLRTGGGLFGKGGLEMFNTEDKKDQGGVASVGMPINPYLWRGSLEVVDFMPLLSADPFGGVIITDWYTDQNNTNQRCKLNIFIKGVEMKTDNLRVNSFCQTLSKDNNWIDEKVDKSNNRQLENAILNTAKKIKLSQG